MSGHRLPTTPHDPAASPSPTTSTSAGSSVDAAVVAHWNMTVPGIRAAILAAHGVFNPAIRAAIYNGMHGVMVAAAVNGAIAPDGSLIE